ncbi:hypothetical protein CASFOL_006040 [Castilleja foliolosa]|uniref:SWIRM domain-containing protein n=1 Tax=Castilleja foliolosa TaxID=1961234 RepID=A0ABD3E660_9LAMI
MDPSNENPCLDITNQLNHSRRVAIHILDSSSPTNSAVQNPHPYPHFRKNPCSLVDSVKDDFHLSPIPKGKKSGRPVRMRNQVKEAQMQNSTDLISKNRGTSSKSGTSAKKTVDDISDEIIVINKKAIAEASIALNVGFPSDSLIDEEINYGVVSKEGGIEQINYVLIRNHIIRKWRENVSKWLTKEMFVDIVPKHCGALLDTAYGFLVSHGYINFGVAPAIRDRILVKPSRQNVIVVGAGLAGLAAARQLMSFGFEVTVLEGKTYAGGRVCTKNWLSGNGTVAVDLGGSVLTGILGNPLGILARQLSFTLYKVREDKCPFYEVDGTPVDPNMDNRVFSSYNKLLDKLNEVRQSMGDVSQYISLKAALETFREAFNEEELKLFNWHLANLEFANASLIPMLSFAFWDQDDRFDMEGDHCFLPGGNGRLVEALAENINIHYGKTVEAIHYNSDGVQVTVAGCQTYKGDMVLCTVPLGVLKSRTINFTPELPQRKLDAIMRLGFGLLNKVALLFPHVFWRRDTDTFGHLSAHPSNRGEFFMFYSYANVAEGPVLVAFIAGEAAYRFENEDPTVSVNKVLQILKGIYEPQGIKVPDPLQTHCTRWGSDPFTRGSYSNVAVGSSGDDYDILAENVGNGRLFFAGEATSKRYPSTMHGALLSGFREAAYMSRYASDRASGLTIKKKTSEQKTNARVSILSDLFKQPDEELGVFALLYGRKRANSRAILRVTLRGNQRKPGQQYPDDFLFKQLQSDLKQQHEFHFYRLLSKKQARLLTEVRGDDEARMKFLIKELGVKLFGNKSTLGQSADSVIASIKAERLEHSKSSSSGGRSQPKRKCKYKRLRHTS